MAATQQWRPDPQIWGISLLDPGWIYAVRTGKMVKVGMTTDPHRRLLREANTWCPHGLEEIHVKPFWNIRKAEYSLHCAIAEFWHRGEWHLFDDDYWLRFFMNGFNQFRDDDRDKNSIDFVYWMNGTNFSESLMWQSQHNMTLKQWRECHANP